VFYTAYFEARLLAIVVTRERREISKRSFNLSAGKSVSAISNTIARISWGSGDIAIALLLASLTSG
jgi:hypothetical protein